MKLLLALALLLFAIPAHGDTFWDISGTVTMTGDNSCNGPCTEVLDFSFTLDEQPIPDAPEWANLLTSNVQLSASGPLGAPESSGFTYSGKYMPIEFNGDPQNEYDLSVTTFPPPMYPYTPGPVGGYLYSCATFNCYGFDPFIECPALCQPVQTITYSITDPPDPVATPEPAVWKLLLCGLGISWLGWRRLGRIGATA